MLHSLHFLDPPYMLEHSLTFKPFELIIFDCDGVLVDSERITNEVFVHALNEVGVPVNLADMFEHFVGHSLQQCLTIVRERYGHQLADDFLEGYKVRRDAALKLRLQAVGGIPQMLDEIRQPYCVASNSEYHKIREMLGITELLPYFDGRIYSAVDLERPKPAPDIYLHAARQQGFLPEACLVIEDTHIGVQAAVSAGMTVYGYAARSSPSRLLGAGAHRVFENMQDLAGMIN
jgi:HAD superfamily hydrolase (TIGR01509 family)